MSDFFELRAPPPEPPVPPPMAEWVGPPENELGIAAPIRLEVVRLDALAVGIIDVTAYTTGFSFRLAIRRRIPLKGTEQPFSFHGPGPQDPDSLLFGIQFADGGKATTLGRPRQEPGGRGTPQGPILVPRGGGGGPRSHESSLWVWPLPPAGPLSFVCEWKAEGISLTRREVDAEPILEAARRSELLWPRDDATVGSGPWTSVVP